MPISEKSNEQVFSDELREIKKRRRVHSRAEGRESVDPSQSEGSEPNLTGLALSGGGIRSAAFSLGFLQAMYRAGRMKAFDYLSTVSGGGYSGGLFSATVTGHKGDINWEKNGRYGRLDLEPLADGSQPDSVKRLALHGRMMGDFVRLFSRHLWGFLINVTIAMSGLVAIAALLAYLMRIPWNANMLPVLNELGFQNDIAISFFCTFLALLIWLFSHFVRRVAKALKKEIAPITQYTYLLLLASLVLGLLTMLAIEDVDIGKMFAGDGNNETLERSINNLIQWLGVAISGLFATSLLPYLSPKRLLRSGQEGASRVQSVIFRAAGNALVIGAPLFIFFFLVHENISGWNSSRPDADLLTRSHLSGPTDFATKLESQFTSVVNERRILARDIYEVLNDTKFKSEKIDASNVEMKNELENIRTLAEKKNVTDEKFGFGSRCLQWLANATRVDDRFGERVEELERSGKNQEEVVRRFNEKLLSDPNLFVRFESLIKHRLDEEQSDAKTVMASSQQLLQRLGLPVSTPTPNQDDRLEQALENLLGARNQWRSRYGEQRSFAKNPTAPESTVNTVDWTRALMELGRDKSNLPTATPTSSALPAAEVAQAEPELGIDDSVIAVADWTRSLVKPIRDYFSSPSAGDASRMQANADIAQEEAEFGIDGTFVTALDSILKADSNDLQMQLERELEARDLPHNINENEEEFKKWRSKHAAAVAKLSRTVRENNWLLLSQLYPHHIRPQSTIFARTVNEADQAYRVQLAGYAALVFVLVGLLTNLNSTSLHGVYRDQLADIWLPDPDLRMHQLDTCSKGSPLHVINAAVNRMGHRNDPDLEGRSRFLLSHRYCGTNKIGFRETSQYEGGAISVADAMAISGGAVTSVNAPSMLHQLILFMTNFRLGQWLASPQTYERDHYWPSPIRTIINLLWHPERRSYLFISDGGHIDNTGLAALMERRCRLMVCVDASQDPGYEFTDLLAVLHGARAKYGIRVEAFDHANDGLDLSKVLDQLRPGEHDCSPAHFVTFKIKYPEIDTPAILIYAKLTVTGEEPIEIVERARAKGHFPHDPTTDQFLPPEIFESYMVLGRHIGEELDQFVDEGAVDSFELGQGWCSSSHVAASDSAGVTLASSAEDANTAEDLQATLLQATLLTNTQSRFDNATFDQAGVAAAIETIDAWCESAFGENAGEESSTDSSIIEIVSPWAQEHGPEASRELRREFCSALVKQFGEFESEIMSDLTVRSHYRNMLQGLGKRFPGVNETLKKLAIEPSQSTVS